MILLFGAPATHAASPFVHAGYTAPVGDAARAVGDGFHMGLTVEGDGERGGPVLDVRFHSLSEKTRTGPGFGLLAFKLKADIFEGVVSARVLVTPRTFPVAAYVKGGFGAGYVRSDLTIITASSEIPDSESNWQPSFVGGVGMSTTAGLRLEARFHSLQIDPDYANMWSVSLGYGSRSSR